MAVGRGSGHAALTATQMTESKAAIGVDFGTLASTGALETAWPAASHRGAMAWVGGVRYVSDGTSWVRSQVAVGVITGLGTLTEYGGGAGNITATSNFSAGFGQQALTSHTSGANIFAAGYRAGYSANTASNGVFVGYRSSHQNAGQTAIVSIGADALFTNNSSGYHVAVGHQALFSLNNAGAIGATAIGSDAGFGTTTANNFTAIGRRAGYNHTIGTDSTYVGAYAGYSGLAGNNTGEGLTAVGSYALGHNTTGSYNIAVGRAAQWYNTTGSNRASLGYRAGYGNTTGTNTVEMGFYAGHYSQGSSRTVFVGALADSYEPTLGVCAAAPVVGAGLANASLVYAYRVAFIIDGIETGFSEAVSVIIVSGSGNYQVSHTALPVYGGPKSCTARRLYRTPGYVANTPGDHIYGLVTQLADNTTTTYTDSTPDGSLGAAPVAPSNIIALGYAARVMRPGQMVVGSVTSRITQVYMGGGVDDTAPSRTLISASDASGANLASGGITFAGGQSTGSAAGGSIVFATSPAGSAGSAGNALVDQVTINSNGVLLIKRSTTAAEPAYVLGGLYFNTTFNKLRIGGASGWETITSV